MARNTPNSPRERSPLRNVTPEMRQACAHEANEVAGEPQPVPYKFFQSAIADPRKSNTGIKAILTQSPHPKIVTALPSMKQQLSTPATPFTGNLQLIVGDSAHDALRTWSLPKAMLAKHSTYFATLFSAPPGSTMGRVVIQDIPQQDLQNFVDYMHSSIYSPNTLATGYRNITAHTQACMLGLSLGAKGYYDAALRSLFILFEPLAKLRTSNAHKSSILASDVAAVCMFTQSGCAVRELFFDAVTAHWTQANVLNLGDNRLEMGRNDSKMWRKLYTTYSDFQKTMARSLRTADVFRSGLLRPMEEYVEMRFESGCVVEIAEDEEKEGEDEPEPESPRTWSEIEDDGEDEMF